MDAASFSQSAVSSLKFTVPGEVRGKGRPRIGRVGPHARMFTDDKTAAYENLVRMAAREALAGMPPLEGPLDLVMVASIVPAASASKKKRAAMLSGEAPPTKKPDLDNVLKAVLDGCNTVAFKDDAQVVGFTCEKVYAETPGLEVVITPWRRK